MTGWGEWKRSRVLMVYIKEEDHTESYNKVTEIQ